MPDMNLNIKAATVMAMASLAVSSYSAFAPSFQDVTKSRSDDREVAQDLAVGEIIASGIVLLTALFATYASGNIEIVVVALFTVVSFLFAYNYLFRRM